MTTTFDHLFAAAIAAMFGLYLIRCFAGALLYLCGQLPTRWGQTAARLSSAVTPRLVKRLLIVAFGIASTAAGASPALASGLPDLDRAPVSVGQVPDPGANLPKSAAPDPGNEPRQSKRVRVAPGDCLWSLAQQQLGPGATNLQIDRQWRRWYSVNRKAIGSDPNTIRTGTWLQAPTIHHSVTPRAALSNLGGTK